MIVDDIRIYQNFGGKTKKECIKDWIFEVNENGQFIRPWAQPGHSDYEYALSQTELVMEYFKSKGKDLDLDTILAWTDKIMSDNTIRTDWLQESEKQHHREKAQEVVKRSGLTQIGDTFPLKGWEIEELNEENLITINARNESGRTAKFIMDKEGKWYQRID